MHLLLGTYIYMYSITEALCMDLFKQYSYVFKLVIVRNHTCRMCMTLRLQHSLVEFQDHRMCL